MVIARESYVFAVADISGESNEHDYLTVQAATLEEAQEKAEQMAKEEYPQWGKLSIECLESESFSADFRHHDLPEYEDEDEDGNPVVRKIKRQHSGVGFKNLKRENPEIHRLKIGGWTSNKYVKVKETHDPMLVCLKCGEMKEANYPWGCFDKHGKNGFAHYGFGRIKGFTEDGHIVWKGGCGYGGINADTRSQSDIAWFKDLHECKDAESFAAVPSAGTGSPGQMCEVCNESDDLPYDSDHFKECRRCGKSVCHECWDTDIESDEHYYEICGECWIVLDNVARYDAESFGAECVACDKTYWCDNCAINDEETPICDECMYQTPNMFLCQSCSVPVKRVPIGHRRMTYPLMYDPAYDPNKMPGFSAWSKEFAESLKAESFSAPLAIPPMLTYEDYSKYEGELENIDGRQHYFTYLNMARHAYNALYVAAREKGLTPQEAFTFCTSKWLRHNEEDIELHIEQMWATMFSKDEAIEYADKVIAIESVPRTELWTRVEDYAKLRKEINEQFYDAESFSAEGVDGSRAKSDDYWLYHGHNRDGSWCGQKLWVSTSYGYDYLCSCNATLTSENVVLSAKNPKKLPESKDPKTTPYGTIFIDEFMSESFSADTLTPWGEPDKWTFDPDEEGAMRDDFCQCIRCNTTGNRDSIMYIGTASWDGDFCVPCYLKMKEMGVWAKYPITEPKDWDYSFTFDAESFSAECVSCSTPEGYYRGWPLCPQSGKPLCVGCCDCNDCRTKWNQLEYGETEPGRQHRAESFSAEGKCSMYCKGKNDVKKGSLACEPCAKKWGERMKKDKDFQRNYNPPEDYYRAESFALRVLGLQSANSQDKKYCIGCGTPSGYPYPLEECGMVDGKKAYSCRDCYDEVFEAESAETIKPMTIGLGLGIVALFLWGRNR